MKKNLRVALLFLLVASLSHRVSAQFALSKDIPLPSNFNGQTLGFLTGADWNTFNGKQAALVSGTNIKTVNGTSLLGSGDITISGTAAWGSVTGTLSDQTDLQTALDGKVATTVTVNGHALSSNVTVTATDLTLGNVTNTSDANKPVSTAQQTALDLKANLASPTFTGTVGGITSTMVGLGSVNNTSDANKPVSTATQTALDLKGNITSQTFVTPNIGVASMTSLNKYTFVAPATSATMTITDGKSLSVSNALTFAGTDATTMTFPSTSATIARTDAANTFTGVQTMTSPALTTPVLGTPTSGNLANCTFPTLNQNTTGSAAFLTTARTIGNVSFDGTANIVPETITSVNEATDATCFPLFVTASGTQSLQPRNNTTLTFNSSTSSLSATTFVGALTGTASGNLVSGGALGTPSSGTLTNCTFPTLNQSTTGSAASLTTSRNINGTAFNGTANISITGSDEDADIVTASAAINTTETIIVKTAALAANRLLAGTHIRVTLWGTCTASAANVSTFRIRIGTAGTTSDGLMQSAATPVSAVTGTAIPFKVVFEVTVRTTGASATSHGSCGLWNTGITGITTSTTGNNIIVPTFTNFNTTTASNIISVSYLSAATTTTSTFQGAIIEFVYK